MEFLRFGGRIPGAGIGCCAIDVLQGFNCDPDEQTSIQAVHGDSGTSLGYFLGKTNKEIFLARLRIGTFSTQERPCRAFLCSITENQLKTQNGLKWLAILRENGFEFIRSVHNSVYGDYAGSGGHVNHIFGLFRNVGRSAIKDPFTPPKVWSTLPEPKSQQEVWDASAGFVLYTEKELREAKIAVFLAGKSGTPPKTKLETTPKDPFPVFVEVAAEDAPPDEIVAQATLTGAPVVAAD